MSNQTNFVAPIGCLSEHLDYFNDNIASTGDFDDIFAKDFDLVFDPELLASLASGDPAPTPVVVEPFHHPMPVVIPSTTTYIPPAAHYNRPVAPASNPHAAVVTPAAPPKPVAVLKPQATKAAAPKRKAAPAVVSPPSVTQVFESIPAAAPKSSPRKRSFSTISKPAPVAAPAAAAPVSSAEANLSFEEQEDLRRERNRHHAKRSRQRKRDYMNQLEDAVNDMRKENERLFDLLGMDSTRAKANMAQEEERKQERATAKFIAGLKQPRNRVLDNTTLAFLRELWK
ncbi:expressed unknown protein [Seminavis robusta]|uniref:BZIP domain-containing protein n=1 Tax=Seminavis robusta TaxID=568900 RepID=A0A9N8H7M0_9STRA|nr:expressed unknown protein [Seminavis robusta]|eukprot:Sro71_g039320.1 n/a (285) ;mRNA; r:47248-48198